MNTKLKIAVILCSMVLLCLASISQAHAYDAANGRGVLARVVAFANSLLEPAVFQRASTVADAVIEVELDLDAQTVVSGGAADSATAGAWMPFMSFERSLDEAP